MLGFQHQCLKWTVRPVFTVYPSVSRDEQTTWYCIAAVWVFFPIWWIHYKISLFWRRKLLFFKLRIPFYLERNVFDIYFFKSGFTSCKVKQLLREMEIQEKKGTERLKDTGNLFRNKLQIKDVCANSRLKFF